MIECSLIDLPEVGHTFVPLIWLVWSDHTRGESGEQSFHLAQCSQQCSTMPQKCLVITSFGRLNCNYVYPLLLWGLLLVSASRYSVEVRRMSNLFALTFKPALQSCLRIHLDCLTAIKSNLSGLQDCLKRCEVIKVSSYIFLGFHQLRQCDCPESLSFTLLALVGDQAPRKDDGTDFGCVQIQSNGLLALQIKCYCMRLVTSCSTMIIFGSW